MLAVTHCRREQVPSSSAPRPVIKDCCSRGNSHDQFAALWWRAPVRTVNSQDIGTILMGSSQDRLPARVLH